MEFHHKGRDAMTDGQLKKSFDYLAWKHLAGAVMDVFRQNQSREADRCIKASADSWGLRCDLRRDIAYRTAIAWAERANCEREEFPYTEDQVVRVYFRYRKRNENEIQGFEAEINGNNLFR